MCTIKKKIQNNNGASMIITLVLFLICAMVSSVIVAAAASGSSRNVYRVEQQRAYLAVSSGARLVIEELQNLGSYSGGQKETIYGCSQYALESNYTNSLYGNGVEGYELEDEFAGDNTIDAIIVFTDDAPVPCQPNKVEHVTDGTAVTGMFQEAIVAGAETIQAGGSSYTETFTIDLQEEDERLPEVIGTFHMDNVYNISIVLTTADSDYSMTISVAGTKENGTETTEYINDGCTHMVYYKELQWAQNYETVQEELPFTATVITTPYTITWGTPVLEKGGTEFVE